eukprot:scaffold69791_cov30-Tisochrysis_lutea.AAC.1
MSAAPRSSLFRNGACLYSPKTTAPYTSGTSPQACAAPYAIGRSITPRVMKYSQYPIAMAAPDAKAHTWPRLPYPARLCQTCAGVRGVMRQTAP